MTEEISRRAFIRAGALTALGAGGATALAQARAKGRPVRAAPPAHAGHEEGPMPVTVGEVDHARNGFDPTDVLTDFDYGRVSTLDNGQTLREYDVVARDQTIEVAPGIDYPAWTYNGRIPGPTLRCTEGDRIRIHFHGLHPYEMDGVPGAGPGLIHPGDSFTYEFDASEYTDTILQAQAQRGILEFSYKLPGQFMFHAHKTEFAELGWAGLFDVQPAEG